MIEGGWILVLSALVGVAVALFLFSATIYSVGLPRRSTFAVMLALLLASAFLAPRIASIASVVFAVVSIAALFPFVVRSPRVLRFAAISMLVVGSLVVVPLSFMLVSPSGPAHPVSYGLPSIEIGEVDWQTEDGRTVRVHRIILGDALTNAIGAGLWATLALAVFGGFALGVARSHRLEWTRELYVGCVSLVILFVLGLYLAAAFANLAVYVILYQAVLYVVLFGVFLQIGAGVRRRLEKEPRPRLGLSREAGAKAGAA